MTKQWIGVLLSGAAAAASLGEQPASYAAPAAITAQGRAGAATDSLQESTMGLDTGDFSAPNRDFSRYTSPVMCVVAAELQAQRLAATVDAQVQSRLMMYTPFLDTMPSRVVAVATACGARFSAADPLFSGPYGLANLRGWFVLSLMEHNDARADTIRERMLGSPLKMQERDQLSLWLIDEYLRARPVRLPAATAMIARVDTYGRSSLLTQVMAHDRLLSLADTAFDRATMHAEAERVIALSKGLVVNEMCWTPGIGAIVHAHTSELTMAAIDHPDSIPGLVSRLQEQYRLPAIQQCVELRKNTMFPLRDLSRMTMPDVVDYILSEQVGLMSVLPDHLSKQAPVTGPTWFPAAGRPVEVPAPGKVSMILFLPTDMRWHDAYQKINMELRRWLGRYGDAGLSVTVLAAPHGHALWGNPETSEQLGKSFDWYYHEYLRLPVTVGLDSASHLPRVPDPDGRSYFGMSALEGAWKISYAETKNGIPNYWYRDDGMVILVNRAGNIIYRNWLGGAPAFGLSPVLETLLVHEFPAQSGSLQSSSAVAPPPPHP